MRLYFPAPIPIVSRSKHWDWLSGGNSSSFFPMAKRSKSPGDGQLEQDLTPVRGTALQDLNEDR